MIELKVTVDAPELSAAINHLAEAIESKGTDAPAAPAKNSRGKKAAARRPDSLCHGLFPIRGKGL